MNFGDFDLAALLPFIGVGFAAQLVDGALGMAFGVISNTLLVGFLGVPPALASQRVHIVECFTTATSGLSHLYHRNIDKRLFFRLLIPGVIAHTTNVVEHPELVAERIVNYADRCGRENVIAAADCGFAQTYSTRRVHPSVMWEKFRMMKEGADIATKKLWS